MISKLKRRKNVNEGPNDSYYMKWKTSITTDDGDLFTVYLAEEMEWKKGMVNAEGLDISYPTPDSVV
ncbi:hypothetical protein J6590_060892 [Homalodisca vitripennis]|nr:hypothetical protein J6590_060892 [Homalodisca vitripennis]